MRNILFVMQIFVSEIRARTHGVIVSAMLMYSGVTVIISREILTNNLSKRLLYISIKMYVTTTYEC